MIHSSLRIIREEHATLAAMLRSLTMMLRRGPGADRPGFFNVVRAMLFYIDEVPEQQHHPKESELLFPRLQQKTAAAAEVVARLERDHQHSEQAVRQLQHQLLAWEFLGESRREAFLEAANRYVEGYLEHMQAEEQHILPLAVQCFDETDWLALDQAFAANRDPLNSAQTRDPVYEHLFSQILMQAPAPIGLGAA